MTEAERVRLIPYDTFCLVKVTLWYPFPVIYLGNTFLSNFPRTDKASVFLFRDTISANHQQLSVQTLSLTYVGQDDLCNGVCMRAPERSFHSEAKSNQVDDLLQHLLLN